MPSEAIIMEAGWRPAEIKADRIAALDRRLGWDDLPRSYRLLNAVMRALDAPLAEKPLRRCGTAWENAAFERHDVAAVMRRVATGFKPDCLDNPEGAILAVLDVLDEQVDPSGIGSIRDLLFAASTPLVPAAIKWSRSRYSFKRKHA